ncbi:hypothetical protein GCM10027076_00920 [Nocardioides montaniterrae]
MGGGPIGGGPGGGGPGGGGAVGGTTYVGMPGGGPGGGLGGIGRWYGGGGGWVPDTQPSCSGIPAAKPPAHRPDQLIHSLTWATRPAGSAAAGMIWRSVTPDSLKAAMRSFT